MKLKIQVNVLKCYFINNDYLNHRKSFSHTITTVRIRVYLWRVCAFLSDDYI